MRKPSRPRPSYVTSGLVTHQSLPNLSDGFVHSSKLVSRSSLNIDDTTRNHHLYHNVTPHADGLYHCPWEKDPTSNCQHKPEKLKCNYDKFVDSHLKPYTCKFPMCKTLRFSSTAALLRHDREAHAMLEYGNKPFLCTYDGCERGVPGNGFPRHWNLRDHLKRVHNDPGNLKNKVSVSPPPPLPWPSIKQDNLYVGQASSSGRFGQSLDASLIDRYNEKQKLLLDTVEKLEDPKHADNMALLRNANDYIKALVQTCQLRHATT
ncbi:hypothetical protein BDZ45DRAFT_599950 [Acephala macrosclerotiorum]|nr:hypothetical protein BDZ45DRAFT_599950 [Acephala macrosclerotiorum]